MGSSPQAASAGAGLQPAVPPCDDEESFSIFRGPSAQPQDSTQDENPLAAQSAAPGPAPAEGDESASEQQTLNPPEEGTDQGEPAAAPLSEADEQAMLATAESLKQQGNTLYGEGRFDEAIEKYADAVDAAPPSASKQRAVYLANIAACDMACKRYKEAVQACNAALEEDATYVKAYMRRGVAQRELDDLDQALTNAKKVVELDPTNGWAVRTVKELEPLVAERHEKLKDEMLGKLKDLGNTILGNFGMSLDNFKADKDPNTGGYSIRFQQ